MSADSSHTLEVDSLVANEYAFEIDNERIHGIFRVAGLTPFKLDDDGQMVNVPFTLSKMVQRDGNNVFNKWLRATVDAKGSSDRPTRTVAVIAIDDGVETRRWTFSGAYITEVNYSAFDSASSEMVEEILTINYAEVDETWGATLNLNNQDFNRDSVDGSHSLFAKVKPRWRKFMAFMRWRGVWVVTGVIASVIVLALLATLPPGAGFLYPLRRLFFNLRDVAYWGTILAVLVTSTYTIPYLVSQGIAPLDPVTYRPMLPSMRGFMSLLAVSIIAYTLLASNNYMLIELERGQTPNNAYLLMIEASPFMRDEFVLYSCDLRVIICTEVLRQQGSREDHHVDLMIERERVIVTDNDVVIYDVTSP